VTTPGHPGAGPDVFRDCTLATAARLHAPAKEFRMQTIAIVLVVLWALGLVSGYAMGGLIHLLLVIAVIVFVIRIVSGRRVV
jgi:hypothetical protein